MMQQIIVYRNPVEAAMWNSVTSAEFVPIMCGIIAFFVVFLITQAVFDKLVYNWFYWKRETLVWKYRKTFPHISLMIGAIAGVLICWKMWI